MSIFDKICIIVYSILGIAFIIYTITNWSNISFGELVIVGLMLFSIAFEIRDTTSDDVLL